MKIIHTADIHIRFGSRHDEYRQVFKRFYEDAIKEKPDRIVIVGDLVHQKINISPGSFDLVSEILINLSKIAPTDIFSGNHDFNEQQPEQGDAISPIFNLAKLVNGSSLEQAAYIVTEENKDKIDFNKKAIYYFPNSGFYNISKKLIYGVYSIRDNKILNLEKKEIDKYYIGFYHGTLYGARGDNGYEMKGDKLMRLSTFNNFDCVMLGDLHQYQTFRDNETIAYPGSLIQQGYGEEIEKGYLLWDLSEKGVSHKRKYILNDYGFAKLTIARGENFEERIDNIKFSNNHKKTKVYIVWEDYEENYSVEKENQIKRLVKDKYGCEVVRVQHQEIPKINTLEVDDEIPMNSLDKHREYLKEFVNTNNFDCDEDLLKEIIDFSDEVDKILEIEKEAVIPEEWELESVEISNLFSFPVKPTFFNFNHFAKKLVGIFGENYNGKSNIIRAIIWGLFQSLLDESASDSKSIINFYTGLNTGYAKIYLIISGIRYYISRKITTKIKKDGTKENSYSVEYKMLTVDEEGNEKWVNEISDNKTAEKTEVKSMVIKAIGTFDDFTKVSLQTQGGKDDYLSLKQQPKNDLINRYMGLQPYRLRYKYGNEYFLDVKKNQKELGNIIEIEEKIKNFNSELLIKKEQLTNTEKEKVNAEEKRDAISKNIIELTKKLDKVEKLEIEDIDVLNKKISQENKIFEEETKEHESLKSWLEINFKKELPFDETQTIEKVEKDLFAEQELFREDKESYIAMDKWIKENPKKNELTEEEIGVIEKNIKDGSDIILKLNNEITIHKGKKCPTCGSIEAKANPELETKCTKELVDKKIEIKSLNDKISENKLNTKHNSDFKLKTSKLETLKATLQTKKLRVDELKKQKETILGAADIITHNKTVDVNFKRINVLRTSLESRNKTLDKLNVNLIKINENKDKIESNNKINIKVKELEDNSKAYKLSIHSLDGQISTLNGDIRILNNNINNYTEKLTQVKDAERLYKKYSIYLQAVHRDGIPAQIIRKKLPIVNNKINNILADCVNFKVELQVLANGDLVEFFYYSPDKSDALSFGFASGSQKFVSTIAIKEGLHHISSLTKPSLSIIDEGFGTLDNKLASEIVNVLYYLRNKYKNVLFVTHRADIKDHADYVIEVTKDKSGVSKEYLDINPHAGVSVFNFS